ncbi:NACHT, LRR and PYD domains-containing protein 12-like [Dendronephthya gigantea]|uniref:NACHT, LRR and PYD domains-containing protein 12-like n=1 Tax=Dendronephthya gigantea TaxID=151771 RepID=UPI001069BC38|nr:NACHT, LRR and PYD domains-containing protein 12-like [Dendronephthya gigantea]
MDNCLKLVPRKCYNTYSSVVLALFVASGVVLVGIASVFEAKSSVECDLTNTLFKGKYIETQCHLHYAQEFLPSLSLNVQIVISFGLVVICSVVYGYLVKHRVDIFGNNPNTTTNEGEEESQPLSELSMAYQEINRELMEMIRESQSKDLFDVHDDFGREDWSRRKLEEIYINVIIQDGRERAHKPRREFESRHQIYDVQLEKPTNSRILKSPAELFQPAESGNHQPRTGLVVGRPGIGKTLLTRKIFNECVQNEERFGFWHEKYVLLIKFRDFNKGETSLREILTKAYRLDMSLAHCGMTVFEFVCKHPKNVILVFDGLDELKVDEECLTDEMIINSPDKECHMLLILKQLVEGKLLPGATVLITSRPTAEYIYRHLKFDQEVEILGFNEEQIEKYVEKFCDDDMKSLEIWQVIKSSPELLSFCYIPVNSYIVCLTLYESIDFGEEVEDGNYSNIPKTITELYNRAMKILLFKHNSKYKNKPVKKDYLTVELPEQLQEDLNKLKKIARNGMETNQLVFEFESSDNTVAGLSDSGVFNQLKDKRRNIFSFLHLTIQEFLAALDVVDNIKNVERFLEEHIDKPRWHLVIQFVAGLLGDRMRELRSAEHKDTKVINCICKRFQDWMPKKRRVDESNDKGLLVIKSVWEMQEDRVMKMISSFASEDDDETFILERLNISPAESTALFKFLSHIKNLKQLRIHHCIVTNITIRELAEFLKSDNCKLTELNVRSNVLKTEGVKYLNSFVCPALVVRDFDTW